MVRKYVMMSTLTVKSYIDLSLINLELTLTNLSNLVMLPNVALKQWFDATRHGAFVYKNCLRFQFDRNLHVGDNAFVTSCQSKSCVPHTQCKGLEHRCVTFHEKDHTNSDFNLIHTK